MAHWSWMAFALQRLTSAVVSVARAWDCKIFSRFFLRHDMLPLSLRPRWCRENLVRLIATTSSSETLSKLVPSVATSGAIVGGDMCFPMPTTLAPLSTAIDHRCMSTGKSHHLGTSFRNCQQCKWTKICCLGSYVDEFGAFSQLHQGTCRTLYNQTLVCMPRKIWPRCV